MGLQIVAGVSGAAAQLTEALPQKAGPLPQPAGMLAVLHDPHRALEPRQAKRLA